MDDDPDLICLPASLQVNGLATHGIVQGDVERFDLAALVVNGCAACTAVHLAGAHKHGIGATALQSVLRLAAAVHAQERPSPAPSQRDASISHWPPLAGAN